MSVSIAMRSVGYTRVAIIRFGATFPVKLMGNVRLRRGIGIRGTNCEQYSEAAGLAAARYYVQHQTLVVVEHQQ